jgi:hypothetical protein
VVFCLAPQYPPVIVHGVPAVIAPQRRPCAHHRTVARPRPSLRRGRAPLQLVRPYPERAGRCGGGAVRPQGNFVGRHRQRVGDDHHRTDRPLRRLRCTGDYVYVKRGRHLSDKSEQQIAKANGAKFTDFGCIWLGSRGWECCFTSTPGTVNRLPGGGECEGKGSEHCLSTRTGGTDKYCGERGSPSGG